MAAGTLPATLQSRSARVSSPSAPAARALGQRVISSAKAALSLAKTGGLEGAHRVRPADTALMGGNGEVEAGEAATGGAEDRDRLNAAVERAGQRPV